MVEPCPTQIDPSTNNNFDSILILNKQCDPNVVIRISVLVLNYLLNSLQLVTDFRCSLTCYRSAACARLLSSNDDSFCLFFCAETSPQHSQALYFTHKSTTPRSSNFHFKCRRHYFLINLFGFACLKKMVHSNVKGQVENFHTIFVVSFEYFWMCVIYAQQVTML